MSVQNYLPRRTGSFTREFAVAISSLLFAVAPVLARDSTGSVGYSPGSQNVEGIPPWVQSYVLNITAPSNLTSPTVVTVVVTPTSVPIDDVATALSYVTLSTNTLTFSGAGQTLPVTVTVSMPDLGVPPGSPDLIFSYSLTTTGWGIPVDLNSQSTINARATTPPPPSSSNPPTVTISTPSDGQVFTYTADQLPTATVLQFQVSTAADSPITAVDATLGGNAVAVSLSPNTDGTIVNGTASLPILAPGSYTVVVRGINGNGTGYDSHQFTVNVSGPPPSVVITQPTNDTDFTYFVGGAPVVVPNSFTATTPPSTSLKTWAATLTTPDGLSVAVQITPLAPSGRSSTGSTSLALTSSGRYSLGVSVTNLYGSASASTSFWINRVENPVNQSVDAFQNATFAVTVTGRNDFTYRWWRQPSGQTGFVALSDGSVYSGSTTQTLTVTRATGNMNGDTFRCVITRTGGDIQTAAAVLTVRKLNPTITWPTPSPVVYGTALSGAQLNATASYAAVSLDGMLVYSPSSGVPGAGNQQLFVAFSPIDSENYNTATGSVSLSVTKAVLTVTAENKTKVYGSLNPTLTAQISGFVNSENLSTSGVTGAAALSTTATVTSGVSVIPHYPITPSVGTLASANYSFSFVEGALSVTPAPLTVRADDQSITVGAAVPALTASYVGLVNGDTPGVVNGITLTVSVPSGSPAGTYTITVNGGTATNYTVTRVNGTLTVTGSAANQTIRGAVFLDVADLGNRNGGELGLGGIEVRLYKGAVLQGSTVTAVDGTFSFSDIPSDTYEVDAVEPAGLTQTDSVARVVSPVLGWIVRDIGLGLNFKSIQGLSAGGFTIGYWKNNIDKAIDNKAGGTQVSATAINAYTALIRTLALSLWDNLDKPLASAVLGSNSSKPVDLLKKQLIASEYNYANGGYINGSAALTYAFIAWGESVAVNSASYSSSYLIWAKDWFDAYNNSHGGLVKGPNP